METLICMEYMQCTVYVLYVLCYSHACIVTFTCFHVYSIDIIDFMIVDD